MVRKALLTCTVSKGMFPEECSVSFSTVSGETIELFVPCSLTRKDALEVVVLQEKDDKALIRLPITSSNSTPVVVVSSRQLKGPVAA